MNKMKSKYILPFVLCVALPFWGTGCSGQKTPDDLPKLYPQKIVLTQEGKPLADAEVYLAPEEGSKWNGGGSTDDSGTAEIFTQGRYKGLASGKYKVVVTKTEIETNFNPQRGVSEGSKEVQSKDTVYTLVETKYRDEKTTPLEITVADRKGEHALDAGKVVREQMKPEPPPP